MVFWNDNPNEDIENELYNLLIDLVITNEEKGSMLLSCEFERTEYSSSKE